MREDVFLDVISGRTQTFSGGLLRAMLAAASIPYGLGSEAWHCGYDWGCLPVRSVDVPVISVGNLTTGGTGKTPTVAWIVNRLAEVGLRPAIVSRGYRAIDGQENDERRLLDNLCAGVPHIQNPRRLLAARTAIQTAHANVIVLDDGFQHRKLHRDVDLLLIDAINPWGYGWLLPRGLLRERVGHLARADAVLITRCELVPEEQVQAIRRRVEQIASVPILRTAFQPQRFVNFSGGTCSLESLAERQALAFCGIGNPEGFARTLSALPLKLSEDHLVRFPDHHHYSADDLRQISLQAAQTQADVLLCTRKDLVKIQRDTIADKPLWALDIGLMFLDEPLPLTGLLRPFLPPTAGLSPH